MGPHVSLVLISAMLLAVSFTIPSVNTTSVILSNPEEMLKIPNNSNGNIVLPTNESVEEVESGSIAGFKLIPKPGR